MSLKSPVSHWCLTRDDLRICPLHRVTFKVAVALDGFGTVVRIVRPLILGRRKGPVAWSVIGMISCLERGCRNPSMSRQGLPFSTLGPRPSRPRITLPRERFSPLTQSRHCGLGGRSILGPLASSDRSFRYASLAQRKVSCMTLSRSILSPMSPSGLLSSGTPTRLLSRLHSTSGESDSCRGTRCHAISTSQRLIQSIAYRCSSADDRNQLD
jgi:hypothetical protein